MMEDWTDIFGEELKDVEETLPADDWAVVRQKYSAVQRRRKAAWWWGGAVASVAAALALMLVLFRDVPSQEPECPFVADNVIVPDSLEVADTLLHLQDEDTHADCLLIRPDDDLVAEADELPEEVSLSEDADAEEQVFDVVRDTVSSVLETLVADSGCPDESRKDDVLGFQDVMFEDFPEEEARRKKVRVAVAVNATGGISGGDVIPKAYDPGFDVAWPEPPVDTSGFYTPEELPSYAVPRSFSRAGKKVRSTTKNHHLPVSYGLSARFTFTRRFSLNTGLNYTMYFSDFTTEYTDGSTLYEEQAAHYIGIPLRCDWMIVDRPSFGMYIGIGGQLDKCIYAKRAGQRLYEDRLLWSLNAAAGLQYNINNRFSLYLEPELSANLNRGDIKTYRYESECVLTARIGLRINL